jgi:cytosine permease
VDKTIARAIEDHALEPVPAAERHGCLAMTWNTAGIVTTLVQLFIGALLTSVAGFRIALLAGVVVCLIGTAFGWACGHIAYKTGFSSTVLSRRFGFGTRGSGVVSLIFSFMIIGFLALENALLYKGFLFYLRAPDSLGLSILIYGVMTVGWILLTTYGFSFIARVSSITLILFLLLLVWMTWTVMTLSGMGAGAAISFPAQFPAAVLKGMGVTTPVSAFIFCVNVMIGSAGALAFVDADQGRYARSSLDAGIAALLGNIALTILMVAIGGLIVHAGMPTLINYYIHVEGMKTADAQRVALQSPDSIAAAFVIFGGLGGTILMLFAQSKAQVLNTYTASLSMSNLFDVVNWRIGRLACVIIANLVGITMLFGNILGKIAAWMNMLGVITTALATIIIVDYFIVRPLGVARHERSAGESVNWAGIIAAVAAILIPQFAPAGLVPVPFFATVILAALIFVPLRLFMLRRAGLAIEATGASSI